MNFDITSINSEFSSLIGFNQRTDTSYPAYEAEITTSDSGLYVDDHPLFRIENLFNCASPNFADETLSSGETETTAFNDWLIRRLQNSQVKLINKVFAQKKGLGQSKELFQDVKLFDNTRDMTRVVTNTGSFVGLEIALDRMEGLALQISRIGTHFDSVVTVPIYLYNSGKNTYVNLTEVDHTTANSYKWTAYSKKLYYNSSDLQPGGKHYIGYFQDDLGSAKAIKQDINFDRMCYGCSPYNRIWHGKYSKYISVHNIKVSSDKLNGTDYWLNPVYATYTNENFGLNLDISVVSDLTQFFIKNKNVLAYAYKMQVQVDLLQEMLNSNRDTSLKEDIQRKIEIELSTENKGGIMSEYLDAFKALDFDYSGLGSYSLNSNRRGIKWRPV